MVYSFDDLNDKLDALNKLILNAIKENAPLIKTKFTRPLASWIKDFEINKLQKERDHYAHVFWSNKFALSDANSLEQVADGSEVGEFNK